VKEIGIKKLRKEDFENVSIEPISLLDINCSTDGIFHFAEAFHTTGVGKSQREAIKELTQRLETIYDVYVEDDSMELTKDAKKLREELKAKFKKKVK